MGLKDLGPLFQVASKLIFLLTAKLFSPALSRERSNSRNTSANQFVCRKIYVDFLSPLRSVTHTSRIRWNSANPTITDERRSFTDGAGNCPVLQEFHEFTRIQAKVCVLTELTG